MFVICFLSQWMKRSKHGLFVFPPKKPLYGERFGRLIERLLYGLEKWFREVFVISFISQWMKRSKHGLFVFPPKKILIKRRHCSIGQSSCSITSKGSIYSLLESSRAWSFFARVFANQPKPTPVCIRSINRSNRCIPVRLFFLFCSRVFSSRSYKNRSITFKLFHHHDKK